MSKIKTSIISSLLLLALLFVAPLTGPTRAAESSGDTQADAVDSLAGGAIAASGSNVYAATNGGLSIAYIPQTGGDFIVNSSADTDDGFCDLSGQGAGNQDCTLREAINAANADADASSITFAADYTIILSTGQLNINTSLTIDGESNAIVIDGNDNSRVFYVNLDVPASLNNLTITNGNSGTQLAGGIYNNGTLTITNSIVSGNTSGSGGGIFNDHYKILNLTNSTVSGNTANNGGGIYNYGTLTVTNSTVSGNTAVRWGGGITNNDGSATLINTTLSGNAVSGTEASYGGGAIVQYSNTPTLSLINSTIADNSAASPNETWSGIWLENGDLTMINSIVANNNGTNNFVNDAGVFTSQGYNISNDWNGLPTIKGSDLWPADPMLGPLQDNGGPTQTMALLANSPAIDAGDDITCADVNTVNNLDQRGITRPFGFHCDIGAFEYNTITQTGPNFVVNTNADTDDGFCDLSGQGAGNQDCTLREAINAANADVDASIITFAGNYTITLTSALSDITTNLTIDGEGAANTIVQASACDPVTLPGDCTPSDWRVFSFQNGTSTLKDMTVRYGNCDVDDTCSGTDPRDGGNIYADTGSTSLTLDAVHVQSGYAYGDGGGIAVIDGDLTLQNNSLVGGSGAGNKSEFDDGGGIFFFDAGNLIINNSEVSYNDSYSYSGGIFFQSTATATIENGSLIDHNTSQDISGGMSAYGTGCTLNVDASTISNNTANGEKGGGLWTGCTTTITNSTISGNTAEDYDGGGIYNGGTLTVLNSTFANNQATYVSSGTPDGGAIYNGGTLTVLNSTFYNNTADGYGGGIYNTTSKTATLINNTFSKNDADSGQTVENAGTLHISNNIMTSNSGSPNNCFNNGGSVSTDVNNLIQDNGSGAFACGTPVSTADPKLGSLQDNGGPTQTMALLSGSPAIDAGDNTACADVDTVNNKDQRGVTRPQNGTCDIGAFEVQAQGGPNFVVDTNADTDDGVCAIASEGNDCTLREAINAANANVDASIISFDDNYTITLTSALPDITTNLTIDGEGAANTIVQASTCDPVNLPGSCTPSDWRVFTIDNSAVTLKDLTARYGKSTGSTFFSNGGGNIYLVTSDLILDAVNVHSGLATSDGGGIYALTSSLTIQNSLIGGLGTGNKSGSNGSGGGIYIQNGAALLVDNSEVSYNASGSYGGGIYAQGDATFTIQNGSLIDHNTAAADYGGGIEAEGTGCILNVDSSTISNNSTFDAGAGINTYCETTINNSTISGNTSEDNSGGGMYIASGDTTITNSTFDNNSAFSNGGGINNTGTLTVYNSTFYNNYAEGYGGGVYNAPSKTAILINNTFSDNSGDSGHSILNAGTLHISNNIIANAPDPSNCHNTGTIGTDINNLIEDNGNCGSPVSTADPILGPLQDNGGPTQTMALLAGSPAIDAGDNATCEATDQRGVTRPQGLNCDIGAVEMIYFNLFMPVIIR